MVDTQWALKTESSLVGKKINLIRGNMTVGRGSDATLLIKKSEVSRHHASLQSVEGTLILKDEGSANGSFVNGVKIEGEAKLQEGDEVRFEEVIFSVIRMDVENNATAVQPSVSATSIAPAAATAVQASVSATALQTSIDIKAKLVLIRGENSGRVFPITGLKTIKVGRSSRCDVVLDDPTVSGEHIEIQNSQEGWQAVNLSQTNGLFVNGNKVLKQFLNDKDTIELGSSVLRFESDEKDSGAKNSGAKIPDWMRNQI